MNFINKTESPIFSRNKVNVLKFDDSDRKMAAFKSHHIKRIRKFKEFTSTIIKYTVQFGNV